MVKIALIGEAWGAREEMFSHALVGPSGAELARMLAQAEITPDIDIKHPNEIDMIAYWKLLSTTYGIEITNVFNCRPPNNDVDFFFTNFKEGEKRLPPLRAGKYLRKDMLYHILRLHREICDWKPNIVVALGNTARWAITRSSAGISATRGTVQLASIIEKEEELAL